LTLVKIAYGTLGLICLDSGYSLCYAWYRERCIDAALEEAFPDSDSDDEKFIKRPNAEKLFEDVVKSSSKYSVIIGSHGTGKSALARKVARKTQGVIYVNVPQPARNPPKSLEFRCFPVRRLGRICQYVAQ